MGTQKLSDGVKRKIDGWELLGFLFLVILSLDVSAQFFWLFALIH